MALKKQNVEYSINWDGKEDAKVEASFPIDKVLMPYPSLSRDFDTTQNKYIIGDNLDALNILKANYSSKINMIYIDPPYNTGKKFCYHDQRSDSGWLSMLYPRLTLSRELLKDDGLIFISIGEQCVSQLSILCDEIFGSSNLVGNVSIVVNPAGKGLTNKISRVHDFLLIYCKNIKSMKNIRIPRSKENILKKFKYSDQAGRYYLEPSMRTNKRYTSLTRPSQFYPLYVNSEGEISIIPKESYFPVYPMFNDGLEGVWVNSKDNFEKNIHKLVARKINDRWKIFRKIYSKDENEESLQMVKSIWDNPEFHTNKGTRLLKYLFGMNEAIFDYPKPLELIKKMITIGTDKESIVLDFFSGSSTTAHAVMQKNSEDGGNRTFIMIQQEELSPENSVAKRFGYEYIHDIALKRLELSTKLLLEEGKSAYVGDTGIKVYKILHND